MPSWASVDPWVGFYLSVECRISNSPFTKPKESKRGPGSPEWIKGSRQLRRRKGSWWWRKFCLSLERSQLGFASPSFPLGRQLTLAVPSLEPMVPYVEKQGFVSTFQIFCGPSVRVCGGNASRGDGCTVEALERRGAVPSSQVCSKPQMSPWGRSCHGASMEAPHRHLGERLLDPSHPDNGLWICSRSLVQRSERYLGGCSEESRSRALRWSVFRAHVFNALWSGCNFTVVSLATRVYWKVWKILVSELPWATSPWEDCSGTKQGGYFWGQAQRVSCTCLPFLRPRGSPCASRV